MDILDTVFLDELKLVMGEELEDLFHAFFSDTEIQLDRLASALSRSDGENIRKTAHTLKGAAASVAAVALSQQFYQLECCGRDGQLAKAALELDTAWALFSKTRTALGQWQHITFAVQPN